jgi:hypothetical protein
MIRTRFRKIKPIFYFVLSSLCILGSFSYEPALSAGLSPGIGNIPQGIQTDANYAGSFVTNKVTNVFATTQKTSCYRPEVPYFTSDGPNDGYSGMSVCNGASNTGENIGTLPYVTQADSNSGYPAAEPMLVKDHSESDIRVDPTNPNHLIGSSKWIVSAEGYNHLLGFYESFDGGKTWPVQGHIPGYEGWTDNTDPVGAFDGYGNYYSLILPYQFFYNNDGSKNYTVGKVQEPNPALPAEVISVSVHPNGSTTADQWITTHNGRSDIIAAYDSVGNEPDKQWITIDNNPASPNYNTVYAMWVNFNGSSPKPYVSTAKALPNGQHTDWSTPELLPTVNNTASDTYLLPAVDPSGIVYTPIANFPSKQAFSFATLALDYSTDGGKTWQGPMPVVQNIVVAPLIYANTTFRDGILDTFAVGNQLSSQGRYSLYVAWEDYSAGVGNILLSASYDGGKTWSAPIQVNDNVTTVDEFQPNLAVAADGTVSVNFYDRRLACPAAGTADAANAGIALDRVNPNYSGALPPFNATNYCVNASIQFYSAVLKPIGQNIRITQNTWDPQLNSPHPSSASGEETFIGDYFGNTFSGNLSYSTFVSTYNNSSNPANQQQQVVAILRKPTK